ncbi:MAG: sigma-70 family RNA polymerase sigma factor [Bacteroidales bacterium]|nr:sigma-70 family RNA polymerase sigma factor [Bacteroidales bacterium]
MIEQKNAELARLISDCQQGSRRAQHKLFKHFYSRMYQVCMRYASNTDEADDMLNEGFLKVFSNLDKYENTGSFESWMKRVIVNAALDFRRKYAPNVVMTDLSEVVETTEVGYDVNPALAKMSSEELIGLIQKLPPTTRMVFNLFVFENYSHAEIAQQLSITEGTSAWHVNAARTRLKNEIVLLNNER